jgi:endonuclease YncB( thermonuclease family)
LFLDLGVYGYQAANCRLWGINAPEMNDKDETVRAKAAMARDALRAMIDGKHVFVLSKGLDKYGRPLVVIWENVGDYPAYDKSVNAKLVRQGLAKEYVL